MTLTEKTISKEMIYKGKIIDVEKHQVTLPDGNISEREIVKHNGAVAVLALTDEKEVVVVQQYRKAMEKTLLEIPAGKLEHGEDREEAAKRELEEETGYKTKQLELIGEMYGCPGFCDEKVSIYFTDQLIKGEVKLDEDEFLQVQKLSITDVETLMHSQKIEDAKTMIAFQYLLLNYNHSN